MEVTDLIIYDGLTGVGDLVKQRMGFIQLLHTPSFALYSKKVQ